MIKELKFFFYAFFIIIFLFLTIKFYFSNQNKKISYRTIENFEINLNNNFDDLIIIKSDTNNKIEYPDDTLSKKKKKRNFLELLINNEK